MARTFDFEELKKLAFEARDLSYSPYSKFRVGACLVDDQGTFFQGANVENAAYAGLCAERTALVKAITSAPGYARKFKAIAITADISDPIAPCGSCRQFLREFSTDLVFYMFRADGSYVEKTLGDLLPMSFGPESLES
ncbi:cytidine deaminase-like protein [Protomyces lactucae-debilis]|uniref:Cytidine deaminase n=1 Tax=Protomyces lactucae-debilis TaxID=2754530 RepID=A0A1Y2FS19_PROLT|nr:cytidine deaminase-like protein [Protomyces lactucae-debilis]ORY86377.1 cytidine deaminase-like protein [Protomyces lactucae-debilis]